jgi:chemotaxis protein methyltransferase CheR
MSAAQNLKENAFFPQVLLSDADKKRIFQLTEEITGTCQQGNMQKDVLVMNIMRRMRACGVASLEEYLALCKTDSDEDAQMVSALTIHTTSWFREAPHYPILKEHAVQFALESAKNRAESGSLPAVFQVWCAACSTGEEVYSFAAVLEKVREEHAGFEYKVLGTDIDILSLNSAKKAIYSAENLKDVPFELKKFFLFGTGKTEGLVTLSPEIRNRCVFQKMNLANTAFLRIKEAAHFLVCRNVLIYFDGGKVKEIVKSLSENVQKKSGLLCLGHSESIHASEFGLELLKNSVYKFKPIVQNSETTLRNSSATLQSVSQAETNTSKSFKNPEVILLGASTGGNEALIQLLRNFPPHSPPVVVVQHISPNFSAAFAQRLASQSGLVLGKFLQGEVLQPGHLYMSLSDHHICLKRVGSNLVVSVNSDDPVSSHRPAVDKLFLSAATSGARCMAFLLTGMGRDGAQGLLELHKKGSYTCAQSEGSCVVFGMPKEAIKLGAVNFVGDLYMLRKVVEDSILK